MYTPIRGRSQLSTFMKAYTAYDMQGGGGLGPQYAFPPENQHLFFITDNLYLYLSYNLS